MNPATYPTLRVSSRSILTGLLLVALGGTSVHAQEVCDDLLDNDANGYRDVYDQTCQPASFGCIVPATAAAFTIRLDRKTPNVYEDLFWAVSGDIDADGQTELLAANGSTGQIDILNGVTLAIESSIPVNGNRGDNFTLANLDDDPELEVITLVHKTERMIVADRQAGGWVINISAPSETAYYCGGNVGSGLGLSVMDFDGDGKAEIFYGNEIWTYPNDLSTGCTDCITKLLDADRDVNPSAKHGCNGDFGGGPQGTVSAAADLLSADDCGGDSACDGPELVVAGQVYSVTISPPQLVLRVDIDTFTGGTYQDGYNAVADIDADGDLDVVVAGFAPGGSVYAFDPANQVLLGTWNPAGSGGHGLSPITIADIYDEDLADDGDATNNSAVNVPEIIVTRVNKLHAMNVNSTGMLWSLNTSDSSGSTSVTVFDFNGDGVLEMAYRDTANMRVMYGGPMAHAPNGVDTNRNYAVFACVSPTMNEGPTVADVDDDGAAELVVVCGSGQTASVNVFESASAPWRAARRVWNQSIFIPGVINEQGEVYPVAQPRMSDLPVGSGLRPLNGAIAQISPDDLSAGDSDGVAAIDVTVSGVNAVATTTCGAADNAMTVTFSVTNNGDAVAPDALPLAFYTQAPSGAAAVAAITLADATLIQGSLPLATGESARLSYVVNTGGAGQVWLVLNDEGAGGTAGPVPSGLLAECDLTNNETGAIPCQQCSGACATDYDVLVFLDADSSGAYDGGDTLLSGWAVGVEPLSGGSAPTSGTTSGAGEFQATLVDGDYRISVAAPGGSGLSWAVPADADVTANGQDGPFIFLIPVGCDCDDGLACTLNDACDVATDSCVTTPFVSEDVSCGVGECATLVGQTTCDPADGTISDNCGALFPADTPEICDGLDNDCDGTTDNYFEPGCSAPLFYAVVNDASGQPYGTIRCRDLGGALDCDTIAGSSTELEVYPALMCPGS